MFPPVTRRTPRGPWSIVLAGGNGDRLRGLTTGEDGTTVPKQYCSVDGGRSLLGLAIERAGRVSPRGRITAIVAAEHRRYWTVACRDLPARNVVVQPRNRGTAPGVLLPLLTVLDRDPDAALVIVPSDHHVADEPALERGVRHALERAERDPERVVLLGIPPEQVDAAFGWIVPAADAAGGGGPVERFVEKPPPADAARLLDRGGLWNSFILAARARTLLRLYVRRLPDLVDRLGQALARDRAGTRAAHVERAYDGLEPSDFSRDLLEGSEECLTVVRVDACGWSDLGTPERVARAAVRLELPRPTDLSSTRPARPHALAAARR
jgi:mannose-1-phosphate guanylyltransferase